MQYWMKHRKLPDIQKDIVHFDSILQRVNKTILSLDEYGLFVYDSKLGDCESVKTNHNHTLSFIITEGYPHSLHQEVSEILLRNKIDFIYKYMNWKRSQLIRYKTNFRLKIKDNYLTLFFKDIPIKTLEIAEDSLDLFYLKDRILNPISKLSQEIDTIRPILFDEKIKISDFKSDLDIVIFRIFS